jgi:hypothetical protein
MVQFFPCGHYYESDDENHIKEDEKRVKAGFLDALTRPSKECEDCRNERESRCDPLYEEWGM